MNPKKLALRLGHMLEKVVPGLITCDEADAFIDDYLDARLPLRTRARFERHLKMCAPCRYYLEAYKRSIALAKDSARDTNTAKMPEELMQAILAARNPSRH